MSGDSTFPDPPEPPQLVQTSAQGPWGGPSYAYRGARIECAPGGHVCGLFMPEHPLHGRRFGEIDQDRRNLLGSFAAGFRRLPMPSPNRARGHGLSPGRRN